MDSGTEQRRGRLGRDEARLWRVPFLGGLDVLQARFVKQQFARHTHDTHTIGVPIQGAAGFWNRGAEHVVPPGNVMLINPQEVNTGRSLLDSGYVHLVLYPSAEQLEQLTEQVTGRPVGEVYFPQSVALAPEVAQRLMAAHRVLAHQDSSLLTQESALHEALTGAVLHLGDRRVVPLRPGREPLSVRRVREYLDAHAHENVSLGDLAGIAGLSPFHLSRVFRQETGLPPHAYQVQVRLSRAQQWIAAGQALAEAALAAGFSDQSAFSNQFKRHFGITPGQYARSTRR